MHGHTVVDARGREVLVRSGSGLVTAVVPDSAGTLVEIEWRARGVRSIRYTICARTDDHGPALDALTSDRPWSWTVEWHRRPHVPDHLPIAVLDLARDADARLVSLVPDPSVLPAVMTAGEW